MKWELLLLTLVIFVSGCTDTANSINQTSSSENLEPGSNSDYSIEEIENFELTQTDIEDLDFYSKINGYQVYRKGWANPVLLDDYTGTRESKKSFKLYHKEQGSPEFGESEIPVVFETAVYRFDNPGVAVKNMKDVIEGSDDIKSSELVSEKGTYYNRQIKVDSHSGPKVTALYKRKKNVILVAATSNFKRFTVDETEQIMDKMVEKLESK